MNRDELIKEIRISKQALKIAGPIHQRDLKKHIQRMEAQLKQYDRLQAATRREVE